MYVFSAEKGEEKEAISFFFHPNLTKKWDKFILFGFLIGGNKHQDRWSLRYYFSHSYLSNPHTNCKWWICQCRSGWHRWRFSFDSLKNCLLIPSLSHKLLSVSQLTKEFNYIVLLTLHSCIVQDAQTRKIIGHGRKRGGMYYVDEATQKVHIRLAHGSPDHQLWIWHQHLTHLSLGVSKAYLSISQKL